MRQRTNKIKRSNTAVPGRNVRSQNMLFYYRINNFNTSVNKAEIKIYLKLWIKLKFLALKV
jgi:hypothetical protein